MCESENDFAPDDPAKVIEVVPGAEAVTLRIRMIGKPVTLGPDRPLEYVFALQATPLKPMGPDGWESRFGSCPWYGDDYDLLTDREFLGKPALDRLQELGVRTLIAWNWTPALAYPWPLERAEEFKSLVRACHARGIRVIPYLGYQISEKAPEYAQVRDEVVVFPVMANADKYPKTKPHMVSAVCLRSVWQDSLAERVGRMIDEFDIDGVYVDSANMPWPCMNALHGCEARRLDGTAVPVYPVFSVRDTFRRLYAIDQGQEGRRHPRQPRLRLHEPRGVGLLDELLDRRAASRGRRADRLGAAGPVPRGVHGRELGRAVRHAGVHAGQLPEVTGREPAARRAGPIPPGRNAGQPRRERSGAGRVDLADGRGFRPPRGRFRAVLRTRAPAGRPAQGLDRLGVPPSPQRRHW